MTPPSQYVTQTDLDARYTSERVAQVFSIQLADGSSTGNADGPSLTATIIDASGELEELLGVTHVVPFAAPYDPAIVEIVCAFAMYRGTAQRRPEYSPPQQREKSPYEKDY